MVLGWLPILKRVASLVFHLDLGQKGKSGKAETRKRGKVVKVVKGVNEEKW